MGNFLFLLYIGCGFVCRIVVGDAFLLVLLILFTIFTKGNLPTLSRCLKLYFLYDDVDLHICRYADAHFNYFCCFNCFSQFCRHFQTPCLLITSNAAVISMSVRYSSLSAPPYCFQSYFSNFILLLVTRLVPHSLYLFASTGIHVHTSNAIDDRQISMQFAKCVVVFLCVAFVVLFSQLPRVLSLSMLLCKFYVITFSTFQFECNVFDLHSTEQFQIATTCIELSNLSFL